MTAAIPVALSRRDIRIRRLRSVARFVPPVLLALSAAGCSRAGGRPSPAPDPHTPAATAAIPSSTVAREPTASPSLPPRDVADWQLVWSDEFEGTEIDRGKWDFGEGSINDCLHYFTDRPDNARVEDGILRLLALREEYRGFHYTAALLKTRAVLGWRYGRIEARMQLPTTTGFVPGFWMLPVDSAYGWWPFSGEIDILEHPTNQPDAVFGTAHTGAYNYFTGSTPRGGKARVPDAESAFHVYALDWTEAGLDFSVDDQIYYSFPNDGQGSDTWPFDRPFSLILAMGVGGSWVGNPDASTVYPGVLSVDYVRVYQNLEDGSIAGPDEIAPGSKGVAFAASAVEGLQYAWRVPAGARIVSGQGTPQIKVDWAADGGAVEVDLIRANGPVTIRRLVAVTDNLFRNGGFEAGVKGWDARGAYPNVRFSVTDDAHTGTTAVSVKVIRPTANPWDVQLSQGGIRLEAGIQYRIGFWAKAGTDKLRINAAVIDSSDFTMYGQNAVELGREWTYFELTFRAPSDRSAMLNFDLGGSAGEYVFDDVSMTKVP